MIHFLLLQALLGKQAREAVETYTALAANPDLKGARLICSRNLIHIESQWSQRCLEKSNEHTFIRTHVFSADNLELITKFDPQLTAERFVVTGLHKADEFMQISPLIQLCDTGGCPVFINNNQP